MSLSLAYLQELLDDGPMSSKEIRANAESGGYSWRTIQRAKKALGIVAVKEGGHFGGGKQQWMWRLPDAQKTANNTEGGQQNTLDTFSKSGHLQQTPTVCAPPRAPRIRWPVKTPRGTNRPPKVYPHDDDAERQRVVVAIRPRLRREVRKGAGTPDDDDGMTYL